MRMSVSMLLFSFGKSDLSPCGLGNVCYALRALVYVLCAVHSHALVAQPLFQYYNRCVAISEFRLQTGEFPGKANSFRLRIRLQASSLPLEVFATPLQSPNSIDKPLCFLGACGHLAVGHKSIIFNTWRRASSLPISHSIQQLGYSICSLAKLL